jgi:signal transduction histidine kinase
MPLKDGAGNLLGYRGLHRDVTIERQIEERIATVYMLGHELVLSRNEEEIAQATIEAIRLLLAPRRGGVWLVDRDRKSLVCHACYPGVSDSSTRTLSLEEEQLPLVSAVKSGSFIYIPQLHDQLYGIRSVLCIPLSIKEQVIGVLEVESDQADAFDRDAQRLLTSLADQAALAFGNARLYERMRAAHDRLQMLSIRLVEVQEAERRHIARELHDEIGQILTGLKLLIEAGTLTQDVTRVHASLKEAQALVNELMTRVRDLSLDLRPISLDDLGLLPALRWHFERYIAQTGVQVVFKHSGIEGRRFASQIETAVYRVIQEALTNVARHANVDQVTVRLWADGATLEVQIEDQGSGFDPDAVLSGSTSGGLSGMYERVIPLGGRLIVESRPGAGTRVTAEIPLSGSSEVV